MTTIATLLWSRFRIRYVCFWPKADIPALPPDVRFYGVKRTTSARYEYFRF